MQTLLEKLKNIPIDAPQVCCSINPKLNKDESLSVKDIKLSNNNPDVDRDQQTDRSLKAKVFVLSKKGNPLMPCSYAKSKRMIKGGKAKVIKSYPFTIQLNFECEDAVQNITLGIDTGYINMGFSAISKKEELLCGVLLLENNMSKRILEKKMYKKNRRRKLRYRQSRFNNRANSKKKEWIAPSINRRINTQLNLINKIKLILPISNIITEIAKFDIQKVENPHISGLNYQQSNMYDYQNMRSYLMSREHGKCQFCSKDFKGKSSHIHHIIPRSQGGTNKSNNLAILHENCHKELHKKNLESFLKKSNQYKDSIFMSILSKKILKNFQNIEITFGYETFIKRNSIFLQKSHINDAFVIAGGTFQKRSKQYIIKQKKKNNRCLQLNRKGFKASIRKKRYKYQPKDLIWIDNKRYEVKGAQSYGTSVVVRDKNNNIKSFSIRKIKKHFFSKTLIWSL